MDSVYQVGKTYKQTWTGVNHHDSSYGIFPVHVNMQPDVSVTHAIWVGKATIDETDATRNGAKERKKQVDVPLLRPVSPSKPS